MIAATNRALDDDVGRGRFRTDLYYRLNVATCIVPPLRDRPEDLEALVKRWVPEITAQLAPAVREVTRGARARLRKHAGRATSASCGTCWSAPSCSPEDRGSTPEKSRARLKTWPFRRPAPARNRASGTPAGRSQPPHWKLGPTAAALRMSRTTLWRRMKELDLS